MKKIVRVIILFSLLFTLTSPGYAYSNEYEQGLIEFAENFVLESYSDFSTKEKSPEDFIDTDAMELKNFIKDREEILRFYSENSKKDINPVNSEVVESKIKDLENNFYEVLLKVNHEYLTTGRDAFTQVIYKIIIKDKENPKVFAAMSNDISASYLFDDNAVEYEELDLDYQLKYQLKNKLKAKSVNTDSYDLNEVKINLKKLLGTMQDDVKPNTMMSSRIGNFRYFTEEDKAKMRRYQDDWHDGFNPDYYNFENLEDMWDCTNYTSQVLAEVCPMKISYSSGITGTNYWYYRSLANRSSSWAGVNEFRQYLVNSTSVGPTGYIVNTFSELGTGSIIQLWSSSIDNYRHNLIVYTQGGDPWVTAHSSFFSGYASQKNLNNCIRLRIDGYYQ